MKINIQMFGGRGASSSSKSTGRAMLQDRISNERTRLFGDERVMLVDNGKVVFNTRLRNINNKEYEDELRKKAKKVTYRSKTFLIER